MSLDALEHGGEGGEEEDAAVFPDEGGEEVLREVIEFGGIGDFGGGGDGEELGVAADLAEFEEGIEDDDVGFGEAL